MANEYSPDNIPKVSLTGSAPKGTGVGIFDVIKGIPKAAVDVTKDIATSVNRSFLATGAVAESFLKTGKVDVNAKFSPDSDFTKTISGTDQAFGYKDIGDQTLDIFGASPETKTKYGLPLGILFAGLDIVPGGAGYKKAALALKEGKAVAKEVEAFTKVAKDFAPMTNPLKIERKLKTIVTGDEASIKGLARGLSQIDDPAKIQAVFKAIRDKKAPVLPFEPSQVKIPATLKGLGLEAEKKAISTTEEALLKSRIQALSKGAREGAVAGRNEVLTFQKQAGDLVRKNLPTELRGTLLTTIRNATSPQKLENATQEIFKHIENYRAGVIEQKVASSRRSKIGFLRKIGELNQGVINEVKRDLGVDVPLRKASLDQLDSVYKAVRERVAFKGQRGALPSQKLATGEVPSPQNYEDVASAAVTRKTPSVVFSETGSSAAESLKNFGAGAKRILTPISSVLGDIDPSLRRAIRNDYEFPIMKKTTSRVRTAEPFIRRFQKLPTEVMAKLDYALKNGDQATIDAIASQHGLSKEVEAIRGMLDGLYQDAKSVQFDIGYLKNYFPRFIKDHKAFLNYFENSAEKNLFQDAILSKENEIGRYLTDQEKAHLVETLIRGYRVRGITLSKTASMSGRILDVIPPELNKAYYRADEGLLRYIEEVTTAIEGRRFLGKELKTLEKTGEFNNIKDSIGQYILNLISKGKLTNEQALKLQSALESRFTQKGASGIVGLYKNLAYVDTMGSVLNAVTQLGDLYASLYRAGERNTLGAVLKLALGRSEIHPEDIGVSRIASELQDGGKLVNTVFKLTGLSTMDILGKRVLIESTLDWGRKEASSANPSKYFKRVMKEMFGDQADEVIQDLKSGEVTENVKMWAFNNILDFQPVSLSEVPEQYLRSGNGRIFYMLKTWSLKVMDVYRREVYQQFKEDPVEGMKNLTRLTMYLVAMGATADVIKDVITGREIDLPDTVVDNLTKTFFFGRYTQTQASKEGLGSALLNQVLPPTKGIDAISKDLFKLGKDPSKFKFSEAQSIRSIPLVGDMYYWWFGKGSKSEQSTLRPKGKSDMNKIPVINIPGGKIPEIKIGGL